MQEVKVKLFRLSELAPKAKAKAIEGLRDFLNRTFEPSLVTETLEEVASYEFGLKAENCYWRLSSCQGDGVAFYGDIDLDALAEKNAEVKALLAKFVSLDTTVSVRSVDVNGRYHHYNSMRAEVECDRTDSDTESLCDELQTAVQRVLRDASRRCAEIGYAEIEYQTGESVATEWAEANGLWFTESGYKWGGAEPEEEEAASE